MSVYFRTPSGTLFEAAYLYGGGFLKDEPVETLGTRIVHSAMAPRSAR